MITYLNFRNTVMESEADLRLLVEMPSPRKNS